MPYTTICPSLELQKEQIGMGTGERGEEVGTEGLGGVAFIFSLLLELCSHIPVIFRLCLALLYALINRPSVAGAVLQTLS